MSTKRGVIAAFAEALEIIRELWGWKNFKSTFHLVGLEFL